MHRIFGKKENVEYMDREGAYLIPVYGKKICSAETYCIHSEIGYFHPIQTYYYGHLLTKIQEPIEKDHGFIWREYDDIKGKLYAEMQNWGLETYIEGIK